MKSVKEILEEALNRIQRGWTQDVESVDIDGLRTLPDGPNACAWCLYGSLCQFYDTNKESIDDSVFLVASIIDPKLARVQALQIITKFNDSSLREKKDVVNILLSAIEKAKGTYYT